MNAPGTLLLPAVIGPKDTEPWHTGVTSTGTPSVWTTSSPATAPCGRRLEGWEHVMDHVRRHGFLRCCVLAVPLLLLFALIAPPAGADADGYIDHFPGDVAFTPKLWNPTTGAYTP